MWVPIRGGVIGSGLFVCASGQGWFWAYAALATKVGSVAAVGAGLLTEPAPGVRGADLEPGDPVLLGWAIAVLAPNFAAAFVARDLNTAGADYDRTFDYELTYDRPTVEAAARSLMSRVRPSTSPTG